MVNDLHLYFPPGAKWDCSTRRRPSVSPMTLSEPGFLMSRQKVASGDGGCARVGATSQTAARVRRTSYALRLRLSAASLTSCDFATVVLMAVISNDGDSLSWIDGSLVRVSFSKVYFETSGEERGFY